VSTRLLLLGEVERALGHLHAWLHAVRDLLLERLGELGECGAALHHLKCEGALDVAGESDAVPCQE
jgi:hypothetical protein